MKSKTSEINSPDDTVTSVTNEFNMMMPVVSRSHSNSSQTDEGISVDNVDKNIKKFTTCRNIESSNCDEDTAKNTLWPNDDKFKNKITRSSSSDSAVLSDDDQTKGIYKLQ